ncbi:MAG TPA: hypothetical protein VLA88_01485 [Candidatus Saccharimonadales bacterium]|nr:hypothetical protein [Candidatus Saccharimonadales bacterium]
MIQLNLLPDLKKEFIKAQKVKALVITIAIFTTIGAVGISALLFVYVTFVQQLQVKLATDDITRKMQQLKGINDIDKYLTVQNQLGSLPNLHESKGIYSRLFDFMSVMNPSAPNNVSLSELQVLTEDKSIVFTGTSKSYETFNVFVDTLKHAQVTFKAGGEGEPVTDSIFEQVLVQSADLSRSSGQPVVGFIVRTVYKDLVFDARNTDMTASVPNITTTQSVTQSPNPTQQLFDKPGDQ